MGCFPYECRHCGPECWESNAMIYPREILWVAPGTTAPTVTKRAIPAHYDSYGRFETADDGIYWLSEEMHSELGTIPFDDLGGATCVVLVAVACRDCHARVSAAAKKRLALRRKEFAAAPAPVTVTVSAPLTPKQKRSLWMALASKFVSAAKVAPAT
jgi:hypothetical protein